MKKPRRYAKSGQSTLTWPHWKVFIEQYLSVHDIHVQVVQLVTFDRIVKSKWQLEVQHEAKQSHT